MSQTAREDIKSCVTECQEVIESFLYFVMAYCWIEDKEKDEAVRFKLWPAQREILSVFLSARLLIILKARQLGLTWLTAAYALWVCITKQMQLIVVVSAKEDWAIEFLDRVRFIRSRLPSWMYPPCDKDGTQHMRFVHKYGPDGKALVYSEIKSLATTVEGAQGKTPNVLIMDETSRNRYAKQIFGASKPGIDKANGRIIIISNSHKDGTGWGWTRRIYTAAMKGQNEFKRVFMPWWDCPERLTSTENKKLKVNPSGIDSKGTVICVDFKQRQLASGYDEDDFSQNYPETEDEAISTLLGSYFGRALQRHTSTMDGLKGSLVKVKGEIEFREHTKGALEIWRYPYRLTSNYNDIPWTLRYCMGSDVSEGLGQSYSVAYVYDRLLKEFVARLRSNRIDAHEWARMLFNLSDYYCFSRATGSDEIWHEKVRALICVETTGAGQTTVKELKNKNANLYVQLVTDKVGGELTKRFGWHESNQAKHNLSEDLREFLRKEVNKVYCPVLIDECSTWIRHENGKLGPEDDTRYGDCVIAAGLAKQADYFMGGIPKQIHPPLTGWRAVNRKKREGNNWTR